MVGIDLVVTKRIKRLIKNRQFLSRVFAEEEIAYCEKKRNREQHYSARFAAKEAVWKALKGKFQIALKDIIVKNLDNGKPLIEFNTSIKKLKKVQVEVSLSHTENYAVAVAMIKNKVVK